MWNCIEMLLLLSMQIFFVWPSPTFAYSMACQYYAVLQFYVIMPPPIGAINHCPTSVLLCLRHHSGIMCLGCSWVCLSVCLSVCLCVLNVVNKVSRKVLKIFSPNFQRWFILGQGWTLQCLGSKVKVTEWPRAQGASERRDTELDAVRRVLISSFIFLSVST